MRRLLTLISAPTPASVLVVTSGWPRADAPSYGIFIRRQVESLSREGVHPDVLVINGYLSPAAYAVAGLALARANLRRRQYALVHAHGGEAAFAARCYLRAPLLVSYMGDDLLGTPRADGIVPARSRLRRRVIRRCAHLVDATITKSAELERALPPRVRRRNLVLPNGVDPEHFSPIPRTDARRQLGWSATERIALFVGDPEIPRKRHWLAAAACTEAGRRLRDLRLHVASSVDPARLPVLMSGADCLLLTSSIEGSPNVVKEALMTNLPVVATRVGDLETVLVGVEPSFLCDATSPPLANALVQCLGEPRRSNGRSRSDWLSSSAIARRLIELYERLGVPSVASS
jgi:glycosyltransferase involved in cell wall biosynthesis